MLDMIVLIAMAVVAAAFAAGLTLQAGLPLLPVLIATAALFLVMSASFVMLGRPSRARGGGGDRLDEIEEALEIIDGDLQRIDRVEDDVARLDLLADRVERLDRALGEIAPGALSGGQSRIEELAGEFENVYARIEAVRADLEAGMIRRLSGDLGTTSFVGERATRIPEPEPEPETEPEPEPIRPTVVAVEEIDVEIEEAEDLEELVEEPVAATILAAEPETETVETEAPVSVQEETAEPAAEEIDVAAFADDDDNDDAMRSTIRNAVERGRIELYLQPTVTLPDRKVRYFEALTRITTADDDLILPRDYVPVAKRAGMMPLIDNVLLVRSVQALRRLGSDTKVQGLFCNVSMHSLLDPDYFPELVEFMEENSGLSDSLIFEISQPEMFGLTESELGCLDTLGALGYHFCLDNVADLDADFAGLSDRYFRYVKVSAASFLGGPGRTAADLKRDLDGLGIQLIIEKVEDEGDVAELLDHGIELAQGHLFAEPKPMNTALARELEGAA